MGSFRSRSQSSTTNGGHYELSNGQSFARSDIYRTLDTCDDTVGWLNLENPFDLVKRETSGWTRDGDNGITGIGHRALHGRFGFVPTWPSPILLPAVNVTEYATKLAANTNPARPSISIPNFIHELRDLPQLLRVDGRSKLHSLANHNLATQFGLLPTISDLKKLFSFLTIANKRGDEIKQLDENGGYRKQIRLDSFSEEWQDLSQTTIESSCGIVRSKIHRKETREVWGSIRWKPNTASLNFMLRSETGRSLIPPRWAYLFGLHPTQITSVIWEALPWSWLVDWSTNVGDYLVASNNSLAFVDGPINVMVKDIYEVTYPITELSTWMFNAGFHSVVPTVTVTRKRRLQGSVGLTTYLPFLSGRQLSILGSLAILKGRRR